MSDCISCSLIPSFTRIVFDSVHPTRSTIARIRNRGSRIEEAPNPHLVIVYGSMTLPPTREYPSVSTHAQLALQGLISATPLLALSAQPNARVKLPPSLSPHPHLTAD